MASRRFYDVIATAGIVATLAGCAKTIQEIAPKTRHTHQAGVRAGTLYMQRADDGMQRAICFDESDFTVEDIVLNYVENNFIGEGDLLQRQIAADKAMQEVSQTVLGANQEIQAAREGYATSRTLYNRFCGAVIKLAENLWEGYQFLPPSRK